MKTPFFLFVVFFCFTIIPARAQTGSSGKPVSEAGDSEVFRFPLTSKTRSPFTAACANLAEHPVVKGNFEQTKTISRLNRSLVSRGNFIIAADIGMVWETLSPFPSTMAVGRDFIIQSTHSGARTKIEARGNETFLRLSETISTIFSGNSQKLMENFEIFFLQSGSSWILGLLPSEKSIRSFASRIILNGDSVIRSINLYEQNGDTIRYTLSNHVFSGILGPDEKALFSDQ
ncbi:MAG: outer membrane lipoprotein carrier protein LolA [Treponema sp.]|jgi:outer membrane lipoprotein-sorting protein|nr:outer membrane lipoprotein carrier protein LolA [Treponema sp.]